MADRGAVCWESRLYGSERGWSATLAWMKYCGTVGKPGGKQRKQTSSYSQGSLQPTRTASKFLCRGSCIATVLWRAEPLMAGVRPQPFGKRTGKSTEGTPRGRGPGTYTRIAEITSGRTISQQGLATTCKDPPYRED